MNLKTLKIGCLALAVLLICGCTGFLTACDSSETASESQTPSIEGTTSTAPENEYVDQNGKYVAKSSGNTYSGTTVKFLTCGAASKYNSELLFNDYTQSDATPIPDVINSAQGDRIALVEEMLDVTIEEEYVYDVSRTNAAMAARIREDNLAFTADYQIVVPCLYDGATLAQEGQLINLYDLPGIQMDAPWWDQVFNEECTIGGQLYFTIGDIGTINKSATAALTFNKTLYLEYKLDEKYNGTPYDFVRNGTWTIDLVLQLFREISNDLNSDGVIDYQDEYGWGGQLDDMWSLFYGSGSRIASTDTSDGYPVLSMYSERSAIVMEKMQTLVQDSQHYVSANDYFNVTQWPTELLLDNFIRGDSLFYNGSLGTPIELGGMEDDFGLLPIPKGDENQDNYYSLINPWTSNCFAVPQSLGASDYQMVSDVLNVMGAVSGNVVAGAYLEQCIEYMKSRDDDTIDMIENYILPGRGCDIGMIFSWGGLDTLLHTMASQQIGTFSSNYQALQTAAQTAMDETIAYFRALK